MEYLWHKQEGKCFYCGVGMSKYHPPQGQAHHAHEVTKDHVLPKSRGGTHQAKRIVLACYKCNLVKANRTPGEWMEEDESADVHAGS